jgi:hypothetical protein
MVVCWASLDLGSYAALEERTETISITSGRNDTCCTRYCDGACPAKQ